MNAKFEQITANAEINNAELTSRIDAQKVSLTEALENSYADINTEIKPVSYTHLDVYKRQLLCRRTRRCLGPL